MLPPALAQDPDQLARFDHEARTLATLNHPSGMMTSFLRSTSHPLRRVLPMTVLRVGYKAGGRFDLAYYTRKHLPLASAALGACAVRNIEVVTCGDAV
jgi:hypothetical protein